MCTHLLVEQNVTCGSAVHNRGLTSYGIYSVWERNLLSSGGSKESKNKTDSSNWGAVKDITLSNPHQLKNRALRCGARSRQDVAEWNSWWLHAGCAETPRGFFQANRYKEKSSVGVSSHSAKQGYIKFDGRIRKDCFLYLGFQFSPFL